ncbi:hypothetical protein J7K76_06105 [Candidatus Bipolaricaulota bacterium]|nr:hypothetical protein [Candidatus Bipolaricaulota bacterium]HDC92150.1 hypothetical protein [Candidatus Acetothermia bacterium]
MWLERYGEPRIRARAAADPVLREILEGTLAEIHRLLEECGREYVLEALVTKSGENMIRMRVRYTSAAERDRLWDRAAEILERHRSGRNVNILCGIHRLRGDD